MQKESSSKDEKILELRGESSFLKQDLQSKLRDLETMGNVIEEHTTQLDGIERKERLLTERAEELKQDKNDLMAEWEKCR